MSTLYRFTPDGAPPRPGAAETWQFTSRPGGGVDVVHFRRTAAEYERSLPAQVQTHRMPPDASLGALCELVRAAESELGVPSALASAAAGVAGGEEVLSLVEQYQALGTSHDALERQLQTERAERAALEKTLQATRDALERRAEAMDEQRFTSLAATKPARADFVRMPSLQGALATAGLSPEASSPVRKPLSPEVRKPAPVAVPRAFVAPPASPPGSPTAASTSPRRPPGCGGPRSPSRRAARWRRSRSATSAAAAAPTRAEATATARARPSSSRCRRTSRRVSFGGELSGVVPLGAFSTPVHAAAEARAAEHVRLL